MDEDDINLDKELGGKETPPRRMLTVQPEGRGKAQIKVPLTDDISIDYNGMRFAGPKRGVYKKQTKHSTATNAAYEFLGTLIS